MTRLGIVFWLVVVMASGFTTFRVKYAVQDLEDELARVRRQTVVEQQEIRVLTAEWTYLTQPERLAELNRRFLGLAMLSAKQLRRGIEDIPLRPVVAVPEPPAEASAEPVASPTAEAEPAFDAKPEPPPPAPAPVWLATTEPTPASLDALFAQIADTR